MDLTQLIIEELSASIGAMMDTQPINVAGNVQIFKQSKGKEKNACYKFPYLKSRGGTTFMNINCGNQK